MRPFRFIGEIAIVTFKTVILIPIVATGDVVKILTGSEPDMTIKLTESIGEDLERVIDEIIP